MADVSKPTQLPDQRFLTFKSEGRFYALPAASVAEVVRLPPLARVPQAPRSLMGLINLRGSVVPVASVRALLGRDGATATPASRLIVLDGAPPVALAVDEVTNLVRIAPVKVKTAEADVASESGEYLQGVFEEGSHVTKILDIQKLLNRAFAQITLKRQTSVAVGANPQRQVAAETARSRLVTFEITGQEYAFPLDVVREIVTTPDDLTLVPGSDDAVRGVMPYRGGLLPLLSLRRLLGLPSTVRSREKVLVAAIGGLVIGFVADRTRAVLSVDPDRIEAAPPVLAARAGGEAQIKEIYRAENGRLVSILAPERLFREEVMQKLAHGKTTMEAKIDEDGRTSGTDELRFVVFRLDDNEFALPIDAVDEVARVPDQITRLPKTPKFLEGVVNLRGEVLPVIDQRRRFEMQPSTASGHKRLVVVRTDRHRAGLIVDNVTEVLRCTPDLIKPSPDLTGEALGLVSSVINLEISGRIVLLLDPSELLTRAERGLLDSFARGKESRQTKP